MVRAVLQPMKELIVSQTGVDGDVIPSGDAMTLGRQLENEKVQLGVFHGIEFAWARQKFPRLLPLVIAVNKGTTLTCKVVVKADSKAKTMADLESQTMAVPRFTREHARLFLERRCQESGKCLSTFFTKVTTPACAEDALDDVIDGDVQAAIVDSVALDNFRERKPARFARLRVLQKSEAFPAAVIAYREGGLDDTRLQRLREGMIHANQTERGERMLNLCRITRFEPVPKDYNELLLSIAKAYPFPKAKE